MRRDEIEIRPADWTGEHAQWCMAQYHAVLDRRFAEGFDPQRGGLLDGADLAPPRGHFLLATEGDQPVGCVAVRLYGEWAEVKQMWVAEVVRRRGLARRLLAEAESVATTNGATTVRLDTNSALPEAIRLYRTAGYEDIERYNDNPYAHHWFEKKIG